METRAQARVGVIDLGSNTILLLVLERPDRVILEHSRIVRLGRGVFESGRLDPERAAVGLEVGAQVELGKQPSHYLCCVVRAQAGHHPERCERAGDSR